MPIFIINKLILFKLAARALLVSPPVNNDLDFKRTWPQLCYDYKSIYYSPIRFSSLIIILALFYSIDFCLLLVILRGVGGIRISVINV